MIVSSNYYRFALLLRIPRGFEISCDENTAHVTVEAKPILAFETVENDYWFNNQ